MSVKRNVVILLLTGVTVLLPGCGDYGVSATTVVNSTKLTSYYSAVLYNKTWFWYKGKLI